MAPHSKTHDENRTHAVQPAILIFQSPSFESCWISAIRNALRGESARADRRQIWVDDFERGPDALFAAGKIIGKPGVQRFSSGAFKSRNWGTRDRFQVSRVRPQLHWKSSRSRDMVSTSVRSQIAPHVHLISVAIEANMRPSAEAIKPKPDPTQVGRLTPCGHPPRRIVGFDRYNLKEDSGFHPRPIVSIMPHFGSHDAICCSAGPVGVLQGVEPGK